MFRALTNNNQHRFTRLYKQILRSPSSACFRSVPVCSRFFSQTSGSGTKDTDDKSDLSSTTIGSLGSLGEAATSNSILAGIERVEEEEEEDEDDRVDMKPSELVSELDRFIIGQQDAKKAVAVALRNRWRRHRLGPELRDEIMPKNILMIGPTGCGKTEIARRLAKLTDSPFIKVEATKFTEVGFHGRDVDTIITDLVRIALVQMKQKRKAKMKNKIVLRVEQRILDSLLGNNVNPNSSRNDFLELLRKGNLENVSIDVEVPVKEPELTSTKFESIAVKLSQTFASGGKKTEIRNMTVAEARPLLEEMEMDALVSPDDVQKAALKAVQQDGIVFLDEIDKICSTSDVHKHADASSEGVQRDLLPLIEGTTITTKHGDVQTDHILFIASGAFHSVKPSDLLAELQGRLPIRVNLKALTEDDFYQILTKTENNLIKQQVALMKVDNVNLVWTDNAIREIAKVAAECNRSVENIGARRLHTVIERIMDEISYNAPDMPRGSEIVIDEQMVRDKVGELLKTADLRKFIL